MSDDEAPITREEMQELFGTHMPIEAVTLIWESPDGWTIGMIRAKLREIAAAKVIQLASPPQPMMSGTGTER